MSIEDLLLGLARSRSIGLRTAGWDTVLAGLDYHGLAARARAILAGAPREDPARRESVEELAANVDAHFERQIAALNEIRNLVGEHPVVLKGSAVSLALLRDRSYVRRSADIDLLVEDPAAAYDRLVQFGFTGVRRDVPHEEALVMRSGVLIDLHRHFPVNEIPAHAASARIGPGRWQQARVPIAVAELSHGDLVGDSRDGHPAGIPGYRVPSPAAAALIGVSHLYSSYHYAEGFPKVRIGEIDDVTRFVRHSDFDAGRFRELARQTHATQALDLFGYLRAQLHGPSDHPSEVALFAPDGTLPPQDLWWDGKSTGFVLNTAPAIGFRDLVRHCIRLRRLFDQIGANEIRLYARPVREPASADRILTNADAFSIDVSISATTEYLTVVCSASEGGPLDVTIHFGATMANSRRVGRPSTLLGSFRDLSALVTTDRGDGGRRVSMTVLRHRLTVPHGRASAKVVVAVRRAVPAGHDLILIPLQLSWPAAERAAHRVLHVS